MMKGEICALRIQETKGGPSVRQESLKLVAGRGIRGDRHYGEDRMQVCLLEQECRAWMEEQEEAGLCFSRFKENILTNSFCMSALTEGDWLLAGDTVLEITQAGKECFPECPRVRAGQDCRLRQACCFAKVIKGGTLVSGASISPVWDSDDKDDKGQKKIWKRYARQLGLPGFGLEGQRRLKAARVLVIGAGGLGCPAVTVLAEAGVGTIGIADGDTVDISNLNRQYLYTPEDIGAPKAECAARWVKRFRPDCRVKAYPCVFGREELRREVRNYDFVLSCVDSAKSRSVINEICVGLGVPFADGSIDGMYGAVQTVFSEEDPCLSCVNPNKAAPEGTPVSFAPVTMMTGALEAHLALAYLSGIQKSHGGLYSFDGRSMTLEEIPAVKDPACAICGEK